MKNRVLLLLIVVMIGSLALPFLSIAPNRIVTAKGIDFFEVLNATQLWPLLTPVIALIAVLFLKPSKNIYILTLITTTVLLGSIFYIAGDYAQQASQTQSPLARISFGGGFWLLITALWLMAIDAIARLTSSAAYRSLSSLLVFVPTIALLAIGQLKHLSILKEYANNQAVFNDALSQHVLIIAITLGLTLAIGIPLGILAYQREHIGAVVLKILSVVQTIPSIALFGLLIAPLAVLSTRFPVLADLGIKGIGVAPAVIALTLYSLLPIVRSTLAGLQNVPTSVIEAARGMGLTQQQILLKVQTRLALPVLLSGLRVTTVQAVGLTVVAALIGAGGFGAIVFRGLSGSAMDLVLLGVIPVVALAICADALFKIAVSLLENKTS